MQTVALAVSTFTVYIDTDKRNLPFFMAKQILFTLAGGVDISGVNDVQVVQ